MRLCIAYYAKHLFDFVNIKANIRLGFDGIRRANYEQLMDFFCLKHLALARNANELLVWLIPQC